MERTIGPDRGTASFIIGFEVQEDADMIALMYDDGDRTFIVML